MSVTAGDDQRQHGKTQIVISLATLFEQHSMNVAFEMVHRDERLVESERQRLGIADANQQRTSEPGPLSDGYRVHGLVSLSGVSQRLPHHRHNCAQMLTRRQLRYDSTIRLMGGNLREHNIGSDLLARAHHGGGSL